jgi:hypothetical protein
MAIHPANQGDFSFDCHQKLGAGGQCRDRSDGKGQAGGSIWQAMSMLSLENFEAGAPRVQSVLQKDYL